MLKQSLLPKGKSIEKESMIKSTSFITFMQFNMQLGKFTAGYSYSVLNVTFPYIAEYYQWPEESKKWKLAYLTSVLPIGGLFAALCVAWLLSKGRRWSIIFLDVFAILGCIF